MHIKGLSNMMNCITRNRYCTLIVNRKMRFSAPMLAVKRMQNSKSLLRFSIFLIITNSILVTNYIFKTAYKHKSITGSTVTVIGNENSPFSTPTESMSLNQRLKICHRWLHPLLLLLCKIWYTSTHGGLLDNSVTYNQYLFYLYLAGFSHLMA